MNVEASEAIVRGVKSAGVDLVATPGERVAQSGLLEKLYGKKESAS